MTFGDLTRALSGIGGKPNLAAVELVEYCPRLDRDGRSARVAIEVLVAALCGPKDQAKIVAHSIEGQHP